MSLIHQYGMRCMAIVFGAGVLLSAVGQAQSCQREFVVGAGGLAQGDAGDHEMAGCEKREACGLEGDRRGAEQDRQRYTPARIGPALRPG